MTKEEYLVIKMIAHESYNEKTLAHAKRVLSYTRADPRYMFYPKEEQIELDALALAHDLIEDTTITYKELSRIGMPDNFIIHLEILTHSYGVTYYDYVKSIADYGGLPLIVKCADIKDHLMLEETLTDSLRKRYNKILPLLR